MFTTREHCFHIANVYTGSLPLKFPFTSSTWTFFWTMWITQKYIFFLCWYVNITHSVWKDVVKVDNKQKFCTPQSSKQEMCNFLVWSGSHLNFDQRFFSGGKSVFAVYWNWLNQFCTFLKSGALWALILSWASSLRSWHLALRRGGQSPPHSSEKQTC